MGKIFYLMGKSASGKDTIYKKVKEEMKNNEEKQEEKNIFCGNHYYISFFIWNDLFYLVFFI